MPSVCALDRKMKEEWGPAWAAQENGRDYFNELRQYVESYYKSRIDTPFPPVTFEKILGEMLALSHWMTPSPWGDTLRQVVCGDADPCLMFPNADDHDSAIRLRVQHGYLSSKLAELMRSRSRQLDVASESFRHYSVLIQTLRRSFDVGVFNLNYDNAALAAWPDAYNGFDDDGNFEPRKVHFRTEWDYVYHLHGSVHHSLIQPNLGRICWQKDLAGEFVDDDGGIAPDPRSDGRLFPRTTLLAGGFKLDQLLVEPFHSFHAALVRHVYAADAILIGGYGFADVHVNRSLHNRLARLVAKDRPSVMILDRRSMTKLSTASDRCWATYLCKTMGTDSRFFHDVDGTSCDVDKEHHVALWHGGFVGAATRLNDIVLWLNNEAKDVPIPVFRRHA